MQEAFMSLPKIKSIVLVKTGNNVENLGEFDFTFDVLRVDRMLQNELDMWLEKKKFPRVVDLHTLPYDLQSQAMNGKITISLPEFYNQLQNFVEQVGDRKNRMEIYDILNKIHGKESFIKRLEGIKRAINKATLVEGGEAHNADCYSDGLFEDFYYDLDSLADQCYVGKDSDGSDIFNPPFAFFTREEKLSLDNLASDLKEMHDDNGELHDSDVLNLIEGYLDLHHEDAMDHIVDMNELCEIVVEWQKCLSEGRDYDLDEKTSEWASKQNIISYHYSDKYIVMIPHNFMKKDAIDWCDTKINVLRDDIKRLKNTELNLVKTAPTL